MLFDQRGTRKYLTAKERRDFIRAAHNASSTIETFCLTLAYTGARISEVLALTPGRIDREAHCIVIESLKKRRTGIFRAVPVPDSLLNKLNAVHHLSAAQDSNQRLWPWSRTTAWLYVKAVMATAGVPPDMAKPKALRHAFGVAGTQASVPLNIIQRWMGHSRIETTAIYTNAVGDEELMLAKKMWHSL
jgi:integrase/recombinase XerD